MHTTEISVISTPARMRMRVTPSWGCVSFGVVSHLLTILTWPALTDETHVRRLTAWFCMHAWWLQVKSGAGQVRSVNETQPSFTDLIWPTKHRCTGWLHDFACMMTVGQVRCGSGQVRSGQKMKHNPELSSSTRCHAHALWYEYEYDNKQLWILHFIKTNGFYFWTIIASVFLTYLWNFARPYSCWDQVVTHTGTDTHTQTNYYNPPPTPG